MVSTVLSVLAATTIAGIVYLFWRSERDEEQLLTAVLASLFVLLVTNTHYSPQFAIWLFPILAILLSRGIFMYLTFIALQVMVYIEFPIMYNHLYTNNAYIFPAVILFFIFKWFIFTDVVAYFAVEHSPA
jgi:hypothetical protein